MSARARARAAAAAPAGVVGYTPQRAAVLYRTQTFAQLGFEEDRAVEGANDLAARQAAYVFRAGDEIAVFVPAAEDLETLRDAKAQFDSGDSPAAHATLETLGPRLCVFDSNRTSTTVVFGPKGPWQIDDGIELYHSQAPYRWSEVERRIPVDPRRNTVEVLQDDTVEWTAQSCRLVLQHGPIAFAAAQIRPRKLTKRSDFEHSARWKKAEAEADGSTGVFFVRHGGSTEPEGYDHERNATIRKYYFDAVEWSVGGDDTDRLLNPDGNNRNYAIHTELDLAVTLRDAYVDELIRQWTTIQQADADADADAEPDAEP
jgi:hypothetical protein